jgi:hypothetical protein
MGGLRSNAGMFRRKINIFAEFNNFSRPHGI